MVRFETDPGTGKTIAVYQSKDEIAGSWLTLKPGVRAGVDNGVFARAAPGKEFVVGVTETTMGRLDAVDWHRLAPPGFELDSSNGTLIDLRTGNVYVFTGRGTLLAPGSQEELVLTTAGAIIPAGQARTLMGSGQRLLIDPITLIIAVVVLLILLAVVLYFVLQIATVFTTPKSGQITDDTGYVKDPWGDTLVIDKNTGEVKDRSGLGLGNIFANLGTILIVAGVVYVGAVYGAPAAYSLVTGKQREEFLGGNLEGFRAEKVYDKIRGGR